ncbi:hypothetical protein BOX15_Mlig026180g1, partial [Macrostomum lignano]
ISCAAMLADWTQQEVLTGTTIMAVEYNGGVVIGADSRTSSGTYVTNRTQDKLTPLTEYIYCCRSGSAADTQAIADHVRYYLDFSRISQGREPTVRYAAHVMQSILYNNRDNLSAAVIVAGWDEVNGGQVYCIPLGGLLVRQPMAAGGSGSTYIWGHLDAQFKPGMTDTECQEFVAKSVSLAIKRDGSSGGVCRLAVINRSGVQRRIIMHEDLPKSYDG